jgi:hypothetical protein
MDNLNIEKRKVVENEIERLEILRKLKSSVWGGPLDIVSKGRSDNIFLGCLTIQIRLFHLIVLW